MRRRGLSTSVAPRPSIVQQGYARTVPVSAQPLLAIALPLLFMASPSLSVWWSAPGLTAALALLVLPALEWTVGRHTTSTVTWGRQIPRWVMVAVLLQPVGLVAWMAVATWASEPPAAWRVLLLGLASGYVAGGAGIVLAHELGHRRNPLDRALARALLMSVAWGHYLIEHNRGHHRHAATWDDPATARREESLWTFLPRYWTGVWRHAVQLSARESARESIERGPRLNEAQALMAGTALLALAAAMAAGWHGLLFVVAQAAMAQLLVAAVDYMEHWGLQRPLDAQGRPGKLGPAHIWDCRNAVSDALLFNLPRHAQHHLQPWRSADELQHTPDAPQMPTGYAGMVLLAMVPPAFRAVMTPRLPTATSPTSPT